MEKDGTKFEADEKKRIHASGNEVQDITMMETPFDSVEDLTTMATVNNNVSSGSSQTMKSKDIKAGIWLNTMTLFLTGAYNEDWNAGFTSVKAASFVSVSTMVAYSTPFVGAILADSLLGDYKSILLGLLVFYIPGVLIIMLTTVPFLLGDEFSDKLLTLAVLCLWPMGTGIVKYPLLDIFFHDCFPWARTFLQERFRSTRRLHRLHRVNYRHRPSDDFLAGRHETVSDEYLGIGRRPSKVSREPSRNQRNASTQFREKFGHRIPHLVEGALQFNREIGNHRWADDKRVVVTMALFFVS